MAKIGEGARLINCIVTEDVVIQPHAVIINSIIGWTTVIGSWTRIEGIIDQNASSTTVYTQDSKFTESLKNGYPDENEGFYHNLSEKPPCHEV
eukprot:CAMPEP_0116882066 /NCGR_PEP_ID=MMETSP0463-20121206/14210_1 /TAXON_ID=181622 /ORGANISM="Strombidinopsis sp, Strain SopsisLIS2011" /LENGTH=92 /DNA_ID=CAMNT_0004534703 /DNA_START=922 /DNA_END=1200 /DNA_ORIENTATION=-